MKTLTDEQKKELLIMLIDDVPLGTIKKHLNLNKNYNLKLLCEYLGKKYQKAYNLHIFNYHQKNEIVSIIDKNILTKADFLKGLDFLMSRMGEYNQKRVENHSSQENQENKLNTKLKDEEILEIVELPKTLPRRLQGENYIVKQTSVKIVKNVWEEFQSFTKINKTYTTIEMLSLAILEFLEKYSVK